MKEILELRVKYDYAHLLFNADEGKRVGTSIKLVEISTDDPRYDKIPEVDERLRKVYGSPFFFGWRFIRKYTDKEVNEAALFHMEIKSTFEPAGEECGTLYDELTACEICGANRTQMSALKLRKSSIPKRDIARTIAGEIIVSEKFAAAVKKANLKGILLEPVFFGKVPAPYYQLKAATEIELSSKTIVGGGPWDFSESSEAFTSEISGYTIEFNKEVYKCPLGHTIGLNLISELHILQHQSIGQFDFFQSKQKVGVKRGLLRPQPICVCSGAFHKMVREEKLTGFNFEIARIA